MKIDECGRCEWWRFWNPKSGLFGGIIAGGIVGGLLAIFLLCAVL